MKRTIESNIEMINEISSTVEMLRSMPTGHKTAIDTLVARVRELHDVNKRLNHHLDRAGFEPISWRKEC
ncbi:hypothetical protein C0431_12915 [bacterium]|nr:hypothetical protein [bacterium]